MRSKRKAAASVSLPKREVKRVLRQPSLLSLPTEILDQVLSDIFPDPSDLKLSVHPDSSDDLFLQPLLQVCSVMRQRCLSFISARTIWIVFHLHFDAASLVFDEYVEHLPFLSMKFHPLIPSGAAKIYFEYGFPPLVRGRTSRSRTQNNKDESGSVILPFNFDTLLYMLNILCRLPPSISLRRTMTIKCENVDSSLDKTVQSFIVPALSTLHNLTSVEQRLVSKPGATDYKLPDKNEPCAMAEQLAPRAHDVLINARNLHKAGYIIEAGLLLLYSDWIYAHVKDQLAWSTDWAYFESNMDAVQLTVRENRILPGPASRINYLRKCLFYIQYGACMLLTQLYAELGQYWYVKHEKRFGDLLDRPHEDQGAARWFGLSRSELSRYHYQRAICRELFVVRVSLISCTKSWEYLPCRCGAQAAQDPQHELLSEFKHTGGMLNIQTSIQDCVYARLLDPDNSAYEKLLKHYIIHVDSETLNRTMNFGVGTFISCQIPANGGLGAEEWRGSMEDLDRWGKLDNLRNLPLARKNADLDPDLVAWLHSLVPLYPVDAFCVRGGTHEGVIVPK